MKSESEMMLRYLNKNLHAAIENFFLLLTLSRFLGLTKVMLKVDAKAFIDSIKTRSQQ